MNTRAGSVEGGAGSETLVGSAENGSVRSLNPFEEIRNLDHSLFERGRGNACSVEVRLREPLVLCVLC